ncbi:hypothetical protein GOBAR_AA24166 [Gossypium barbadense]|uniref:RNase H type-1 domain-containing protein n=1 Tax=Gossypium barbadense TaxID=3634 RepID=A0A2P5WZJ2_GOSBA|nr:hypothetical protein GOBAR_AA24166 [Gossypium barbadense]
MDIKEWVFVNVSRPERFARNKRDWDINSDGGLMTDSRLATCGGVMRDHAVKWLAGFARKVGTSTDSNAELWGAYDGLNMAWAVGAQQSNPANAAVVLGGSGSAYIQRRPIMPVQR